MPTLRHCPFCEKEHKFQMLYDEEGEALELWCRYTGILVERVSKEERAERFCELRWQFVCPVEE
ncbi:hypothetical protein ACFLTZ_01660 [Chloroflexota bacterium]